MKDRMLNSDARLQAVRRLVDHMGHKDLRRFVQEVTETQALCPEMDMAFEWELVQECLTLLTRMEEAARRERAEKKAARKR